ncbi:MAG TPA: HPr family phosphocarrier protein [Candidatus Faecivivens stercorigallinarum]|nr:HPr family phosphocarrier protein [Candidatus Faecivivens stercorigallinarum]
MKKVCQIQLKTVNEVKHFVDIMTQCPYDVDLLSGRYVIDAKSLMGIFSLDLTKPIDLAVSTDDVDDLLKKIDFCIIKND